MVQLISLVDIRVYDEEGCKIVTDVKDGAKILLFQRSYPSHLPRDNNVSAPEGIRLCESLLTLPHKKETFKLKLINR